MICVILAIIALVGYTGLAVFRHQVETDPSISRLMNKDMPVMVAKAEMRQFQEVVGAPAEVQPYSIVNLRSTVEGHIEDVKVDLGDLVKPGQRLVQIDQTVFKAILETSRSNVSKTKAELENRRANLERISNLFSKKLVPKVEIENAQAHLEAAKYDYSLAQQELVEAEHNLKNTTIASPVVGMVIERIVNPKEFVSSNQQLLSLGVLDKVWVVARVPEEKLPRVHLGQQGEIVFDAYPQEVFHGEANKIDPQVNPETKTFLAYVKVDNSLLQFKPGMTAYVRINSSHYSLAVPSVAVINPIDDEPTLFSVDEASIAHLRQVKIGIEAAGYTEIREGLKEGEQVVTVGQIFLRDGDPIKRGEP